MGLLDGQVVVFTGAGSGIGRAVVKRYVAEGARVVAVDVSERVKELPGELGDLGGPHELGGRRDLAGAVIPVVADVSTWEGNAQAVTAALDSWGKLDVFVGNAGITDGAQPLEDIPGEVLPAGFHELFSVNVLAPLLGVRAALDALIASRGSVILTGSFAGSNAAGGGVLYTASKHAVEGLVRQLAYELAPDVRVNGVAPGVAPTRLRGTTALGQSMSDSVLDGTREALPLQEVPPVESYGGIYTLLASRTEAAIMTGTMITADSGLAVRGIARPGGRVGRK
ncbi:SDR family NAD(P)-dependent oxidoreductase [Streptomyces sp. NPDC005262]|uniref:SDR family NAD(P)-dependent oxidoreductase n=1 Tax=Streptomyces sp. NPDC005262 TaxID=3364710 RepID=UPI0036B3EE4C